MTGPGDKSGDVREVWTGQRDDELSVRLEPAGRGVAAVAGLPFDPGADVWLTTVYQQDASEVWLVYWIARSISSVCG